MATQADVRRIALSLPETEEGTDRFAFSVRAGAKSRGFVWVWMERPAPKASRVPNAGVIAARVASVAERDLLISMDPRKFFTEPHYHGFPAVLVRLRETSVADLRLIITEAWRCQAPKALASLVADGTSDGATARADRPARADRLARPARHAGPSSRRKRT